jgi:hypothetical protein
MSEEKVFDYSVTGRPQDVVSTVLRKISAFTREHQTRRFKIGITNNPKRRFNKGHKFNYDEMIVVYSSKAYNSVCELERELVEHNKGLADNLIGGGGGRKGTPPYFMYVVIKHKS